MPTPPLTIRSATPADIPVVFELIRGLAEYERLLDEFQLTHALLDDHLFGERPYCEAILAETPDQVVGMALYFFTYSTFAAAPSLYLEDVFVLPEHRGKGHGKALLAALARIAVERGCVRFEWSVLDWNQPSIDFYVALGAEPLDAWTKYRVHGDALMRLASASPPIVGR
jgi:GNAT superfamily N-acetyltransferase